MKNTPYIIVYGIDHSASLGGDQDRATSYPMKVGGWLAKEDKQGYHIVPWMFAEDPDDEHNITFFIAKTKGQKVRKLKGIK